MKENTRKAIDARIKMIMNEFPFKKVQAFMTTGKWSRGVTAEQYTVENLKRCARGLLNDAVKYKGFASTFGFTALYRKVKDKEKKGSYMFLQLFWGYDSLLIGEEAYTFIPKEEK
jgi:hypothetical protein